MVEGCWRQENKKQTEEEKNGKIMTKGDENTGEKLLSSIIYPHSVGSRSLVECKCYRSKNVKEVCDLEVEVEDWLSIKKTTQQQLRSVE